MEQRAYSRVELNLPVQFILNQKAISCRIINISEGGAFLKVEAESEADIHQGIIGMEAVFVFNSKLPLSIRPIGKIVRLFENDGKFLAIRFEATE